MVIGELAGWQVGQKTQPTSSSYKEDLLNRKGFNGVSKHLKRTNLGIIQENPFNPANVSLQCCKNRPPWVFKFCIEQAKVFKIVAT